MLDVRRKEYLRLGVTCDRPLRGMPHPFDKLHPQMYASELAGTAVSRLWEGWWIYWLGPCLGAALAVLLLRNDLLRHLRPVEARLCHFGHHGATGKPVGYPVIRSVTRVLSSLQIAFEGYQGLVGCHRQRPST